MAVPNQIRITELDYDQILTNLIAFMKTDPAFADYDFTGSGLQMLARVLAYATFYLNYYTTAAVNESFLDSAQLRTSVVSHAKMLGYDAHGTQSARLEANVAIQLEDSSAVAVTLPAYTQFILGSNNSLTFYNLTDVELVQNTDTQLYEGAGVELVEGTPLTYRFTADITNPTQRFVIPNANVDYSTISVNVQAAEGSNVITGFLRANSYITVAADDPVFFVQEAYDGYPELKFGNGTVGRALEQGNIVIATFLISRGEEGNNVRGPFTIPVANVAGFLTGNTGNSTTITSNSVASMGGSSAEDLDEIRFMAPLVYQAQNRCVTTEDYKAAILAVYGERISAINVFGGEEGDPSDPANRPIYGRVFIAVKPRIGLRFTDITRKNIETEVLGPKTVVGVVPQVIDPDYTWLNVSTSVKYDPRLTTKSRSALQDTITEAILDYSRDSLEKFDTAFYYSKFAAVIDGADASVVSSMTRVDLEKRVYPVLGESNQAVLKFNSPLRVPTRTALNAPIAIGTQVAANQSVILPSSSHRFTYDNDNEETVDNCFLYEWGGVVHVAYRAANGVTVIHQTSVGTLDSDTGLMLLSNFRPTAIEGGEVDVRVRVIPTVNDFTPSLNQLFTMDETGISVQILNLNTATLAEQAAFFVGGVLP